MQHHDKQDGFQPSEAFIESAIDSLARWERAGFWQDAPISQLFDCAGMRY